MTNPAQAYARTAQQTLQGRALEAHILLKSAARLQAIKDSWPAREGELQDALLTNRKIWTVFVTAMTQEDCELPNLVRSNIVNLGMFVFNRTLELAVTARPEQLSALIEINRNLAAGLRCDGGTAAAPSAA
jgi:flagellar biosynthesis activator protein FlaF